MPLLTPDILTKIAPVIKGQQAVTLSDLHNAICPLYGINTPDIFHEFIANELEESNCFQSLSENLNYSVKGLLDTFQRHRISEADCKQYGRTLFRKANQQAIANIIYGGQWGLANLGNQLPNDGWQFRGASVLQITGRGSFTAFTKYYNNRFGTTYTPEQMSDLLRTDLKLGIHSACWEFAISKNLIQAAIDDNFNKVVKAINGGYNGLQERLRYYNLAKQYIV